MSNTSVLHPSSSSRSPYVHDGHPPSLHIQLHTRGSAASSSRTSILGPRPRPSSSSPSLHTLKRSLSTSFNSSNSIPTISNCSSLSPLQEEHAPLPSSASSFPDPSKVKDHAGSGASRSSASSQPSSSTKSTPTLVLSPPCRNHLHPTHEIRNASVTLATTQVRAQCSPMSGSGSSDCPGQPTKSSAPPSSWMAYTYQTSEILPESPTLYVHTYSF